MAISKPSWLRDWLLKLNWDILTWHVYVGDAIESGIDWVIDGLNEGIDRAQDAWDKAVQAWDKAVEVGKQAWKDLQKEADKLSARIDTWWDDLSDWWDAWWDDIRDWVTARLQPIKDWLTSLEKWVAKLDTWWDNFKTNTLPNLIDRVKLADWGKAEVDPIKKDVAQHSSWFSLLKDLMADPEKWLLDRITSMLARFI